MNLDKFIEYIKKSDNYESDLWQATVDASYEHFYIEEDPDPINEMIHSLEFTDKLLMMAVLLAQFSGQVNNGGIYQYCDNGYAGDTKTGQSYWNISKLRSELKKYSNESELTQSIFEVIKYASDEIHIYRCDGYEYVGINNDATCSDIDNKWYAIDENEIHSWMNNKIKTLIESQG